MSGHIFSSPTDISGSTTQSTLRFRVYEIVSKAAGPSFYPCLPTFLKRSAPLKFELIAKKIRSLNSSRKRSAGFPATKSNDIDGIRVDFGDAWGLSSGLEYGTCSCPSIRSTKRRPLERSSIDRRNRLERGRESHWPCPYRHDPKLGPLKSAPPQTAKSRRITTQRSLFVARVFTI